jgi:hypothetical protein
VRSLQEVPLPPGVTAERGLLILPGGALVTDTPATRREMTRRHKDGFGYGGYNAASQPGLPDDPVVTERYGYPSDDYSEESMP